MPKKQKNNSNIPINESRAKRYAQIIGYYAYKRNMYFFSGLVRYKNFFFDIGIFIIYIVSRDFGCNKTKGTEDVAYIPSMECYSLESVFQTKTKPIAYFTVSVGDVKKLPLCMQRKKMNVKSTKYYTFKNLISFPIIANRVNTLSRYYGIPTSTSYVVEKANSIELEPLEKCLAYTFNIQNVTFEKKYPRLHKGLKKIYKTD